MILNSRDGIIFAIIWVQLQAYSRDDIIFAPIMITVIGRMVLSWTGRTIGTVVRDFLFQFLALSVNLVFRPLCCYDSSLILLSFFSKPFLPRARGVCIDTDKYFSIKVNS